MTLKVKYTEHLLAKEIDAKSQELSNATPEIRQRIQEFSYIVHKPGQCELC